ncbi:hypothetical protein BCR44DRAFT_362756 [Catenaria anguillulae PL171]|uniref:DUF3752 domain-containing protein n=1 Tax=Catenaria anguillulae PL171 TaxID=765915 RepID=A0A1Y2HHF5_9FUNG|nr:hypothetical protein BCR44DRAFT_362756 [Catenaria anguillulae PL171]
MDDKTIGPALPPHLAAKRQARRQQQGTNGPSSPSDAVADAIIGPVRPPKLAPEPAVGPSSSSHVGKDDHDDVPIGPQRPPKRASTAELSAPQPVIGPARPAAKPVLTPASHVSRPTHANSDSDSDSDDDLVGPRPPSPSQLARMRDPEYLAQLQREEALTRIAQAEEARAESERQAAELAAAGPQRGEWMLVPPSAKGPVGLPVDGSRMKSRTFNSRQADLELDRGWTETPAEKADRLAKGETIAKPNKRKHDEPKPMSQRDRQLADAVQQYNAANRGESLTESYTRDDSGAKKRRKEAADDPRARGFDRDRDVLGTKTISAKDRAKMVQEAKTLDSKFSHGSSAYL